MDNGYDYRAQATKLAFDMDSNLQAHFCREAVAAQQVALEVAPRQEDSAAKFVVAHSLLCQTTKYAADGPMIKRPDRLTWH